MQPNLPKYHVLNDCYDEIKTSSLKNCESLLQNERSEFKDRLRPSSAKAYSNVLSISTLAEKEHIPHISSPDDSLNFTDESSLTVENDAIVPTFQGGKTAKSTFTFNGNSAFLVSLSGVTASDFGTGTYIKDPVIYDAEKNQNPSSDTLMCWAGTASNMLAYTGWGLAGLGLSQTNNVEDRIFQYFSDNFSNQGQHTSYAIEWFFNGEMASQYGAQPKPGSGNTLGISADEYLHTYWSSTGIGFLNSIESALKDSSAVGLTINHGSGDYAHAVTCWGYTYNNSLSNDNYEYYTGIFISDSDNQKYSSVPEDIISYIPIYYSNNTYYLDDNYYPGNYYISIVSVLDQMDSNETIPSGVSRNLYSASYDTIIFGTQNVYSGGSSYRSVISSGGRQNVYHSGLASGTTICSGGTQLIFSGGKSIDDSINGGQSWNTDQYIYSGGIADTTNIYSNAHQSVQSGGLSLNARINYSGFQEVYASGVASNAIVGQAGKQTLFGKALNTTLSGGAGWASQYIYSGGLASATYITDGYQYIDSGGTASGTVLGRLGYQTVYYNGSAANTTVSSGGTQTVSWGGQDRNTRIYASGSQVLMGTATSTTISSGGTQQVSSGGHASQTTVGLGGVQSVTYSGNALNTTLSGGAGWASQYIYSGGHASGTDITDGYQYIFSGGTASGTVLGHLGSQNVSSGGRAFNTTIYSGGYQQVSYGGLASGISVLTSGRLDVLSGGSAFGVTVSSGGRFCIYSGGYASSGVVNSGAAFYVGSGGRAYNISINSGAIQYVAAGAVVNGTSAFAMSGNTWWSGGASSPYGYTGSIISNSAPTPISSGVILAGASQNVYGVTYDMTVFGTQNVYSGGSAYRSIISSGGLQNVGSSGFVSGTTVYSNGTINFSTFSATGQGITIKPGGYVNFSGSHEYLVSAGGTLSNVSYTSGTMYITSGMAAKKFTVFYNGWQHISSGGSTTSATVSYGGYQKLFSGGKTISTFLSGGSQYVLEGGNAQKTIIAAGIQTVSSGGKASGTVISSGYQYLSFGGVASKTTLQFGGSQIVYSGATARSVTVSSGGTLSAYAGAKISTVTLKAGGQMSIEGGTTLAGKNSVTSAVVTGGTKTSRAILAKKATLTACGSADMSGLHLIASSANLVVKGVGNKLGSLKTNSATKVNYDITNVSAKETTAMLKLSTKASQLGSYSINVAKAQDIGTYELSTNLTLASKKDFTINLDGTKLGTAKLNSTKCTKNGVIYSLKATNNQIKMTLSLKLGKILKGTSKKDTLTGTTNSDIFYGGKGSDTVNGKNGRDVAVYDKTNWGKDVVAKTNGTMTLLFKDLKSSDITKKVRGNDMIITKKTDAKQSITVKNWSETTHDIVYGTKMTKFDAFLKAASPTKAQTTAARTEVWKKAGLATA